MSQGSWHSKRAVRIAIILVSIGAFLGWSLFIWTLATQKQYRTQTAEQQAAYHGPQPQKDSNSRCSVISGLSDAFDCFIEKIAASRNTQRSEQDLAAQQSMADWALWIVIVSAVQSILSLGGIVLLWQNLIQVHKSNESGETSANAAVDAANAAKKSAELQEESFRNLERPYLFIVIKETRRLHRPGNEIPHLKYTFSNYGKTPAILEHIFVELRPTAELQFINGMPRIPMNSGEAWYDVIAPGGTLSEVEPRILNVRNAVAGDAWTGKEAQRLALHGSVSYQDPSGNRYTDHFVMVGNEGGYSFRLQARKQTTNL